MNQEEFNVLITNIAAITNQAFAIKCGEFAAHMSGDESNNQISNKFDHEKFLEDFNVQEMLDSGYESISTLYQELEDLWNGIDLEVLSGMMANIPSNLPNISSKLTPDQFKLWIVYAIESSDDDPLYALHRYITGSMGADDYDEVHDSIREAIAFDELTGLIENEDKIRSEHILLNDLITAATIQSFKVFEWLISRARLDDKQVVELLDSNIADINIFVTMYKIIVPNADQRKKIKSIAINKNEDAVVKYLDRFNKDVL